MHNFQDMGERTMQKITTGTYVVSRSTPGDLTRKKDAILSSLEVVVNELMNTSTFFENRVFLPKKSIC